MAERFRTRPWGGLWGGGNDGAPGRVTIRRSNGEVINLPSKATIDLEPSDEVIIETPGGGGWGGKS